MSNSISNMYTKFDYFPSGVWPYRAMSSAANKESFLKQFDQIVEGIKAGIR